MLEDHVKKDKTVVGKKIHNQYYIDLPLAERHFWSPELRVTAEKDEFADHDDTIIRVTVGPQYTVWALFVFIYTFLSIACLFGGMYGLTQLAIGKQSLWIWCLPVTLALILAVYVISKTGQQSTRNQTLHLVSTLYHALGQEHVVRVEE